MVKLSDEQLKGVQDLYKSGDKQGAQDLALRYSKEQTSQSGLNSMSQTVADNNKVNSQVGTGAVAPMPEKTTPTVQQQTEPSTQQKLAETWNNLTYEQQQERLKTVKGLKDSLAKYGLTSKTQPEQTTTPTTTPTTTKPTSTKATTPTTPKQEQWDYQDNSQARMNQIADNLNNYRQTMPELFDDMSAFYNFFIKDKGRSQDQIDFLWDYYNRVQKYGKYDNLSPDAIGSSIANGKIPQDYLDYLKATDPTKYQEVMQYKKDAEDTIVNESYLSELSDEAGMSGFMKFYTGIYGYEDKNNDKIDDHLYIPPTEEEQKNVDRINTINSRRMEIKNMMKNLLDDLVEQYPGVPKATLMGIVQDRTKDLQREDDDLAVELAQLQGTVDYQQNERDAQMKARQSTINNLEKAYGMYYDYTPEGMAEYAQNKYAATNITLDQADSGTETQKQMALDGVLQGYYDKYGSILQRSKEQVINDVIAYAKKNGVGLAEAFQENFVKPLQSKPEFATISSGGSLGGTKYATVKDGNGNIVMYDTSTGDYTIIGGGTGTTTASGGTVTNSYGKTYTPMSTTQYESGLGDFLLSFEGDGSTYGGQCGAFINNGLKAAGVITDNIYDNSLESKLNSKNRETSETAQAGWVAIRNPDALTTANGKKHGHVGFVLSDNGNTVTVIDSNWLDKDKDGTYDETTYVHDVPKKNLHGYFDPTKEYGASTSVDDIMTEYGVPLLFHNSIWGDIPQKEKDNTKEKDDIQARIKALYDAGLDAQTASVVYKGWNIQPGVEPELSNQLLTTLLSTTEMPESSVFRRISNFINSGQTDVAIKIAEEFINEQAKDDMGYVSELQVKNILNKSSSMQHYITSLNKNPIGNFSGTVQQWLGKFKGAEATQIKNYLSDIEAYMKDTMNLDDDRIKDIVPQLDDSIKNFAAKLNGLQSAQLALLNNRRRMYLLPSLGRDDVGKIDTRYNVYVKGANSQGFDKAK